MNIPSFRHPDTTREGRIERAVWTLLEGERLKVPVASSMSFLQKKGCSAAEVLEALNTASDGALVRSAFGGGS